MNAIISAALLRGRRLRPQRLPAARGRASNGQVAIRSSRIAKARTALTKALAIAFASATLASGAAAQTGGCTTCETAKLYYDKAGAPTSGNLVIQVTASVGGRCGFASGQAPSGSFNQPNFDATGFTNDFTFTLDCTGPSRVAVVSTNGGLLTSGSAPSGYATKAPYSVALFLKGNSGSASATCTAASLAAGATPSCADFRGPVSNLPAQGLRLAEPSISQTNLSYVRVSAPAYAGAAQLVAGTYNDTLTITLSASP